MESFPFTDRVPDQSLIRENNYVPAERIQATRGNDYLFVYSCAGKPFTMLMGKIKGPRLKGFWYDPRNGKTTDVPETVNTDTAAFTPPSKGYGQDWVLVLFDAEKNYKLKD
jgi:hypothetical protein